MHPNEKLLREADEAMLREDMDAFWAAYTDDVVVHIAGRNQLAGTYKGKGELQDLFSRFMGLAGEFSFEPHDYLANDQHGIVLQRSKYDRGGKSVESDEVFVFHFRDGKISEFWFSAQDQATLDEFLG
jgi:ketosteroid isomerase-like protein